MLTFEHSEIGGYIMKKLTDKIKFRHGAIINNRLVQTPMLTNSGKDEHITQDTINYYAQRSQSAGMVIVEYTSVSPNGGPSRSWAPDREQLAIYDNSFKPGFSRVATALKKDGNKAILQLVHSGGEAQYNGKLGNPIEVPSIFDGQKTNYPLHELTDEEIRQIIKDFGTATKRAIDCGFDGVEIHGANHYLHQQFFSRYTNRRNDYWGGNLEKRMHFAYEVAKEVFKVVNEYAPDDFIVGYRISPEEIHRHDGYTWHESTELVNKLTTNFSFDYIHLSLLDYKATPSDSDKTYAELFHPVLNGALEIVAGGIRTEEQMLDALNYMDLIGIGRATLIDPQIGLKINEGRGNEIIHEFSAEGARKSNLTPGLIDLLLNTTSYFGMPGVESLAALSNDNSKLDDAVTHNPIMD